MRKNNNYINWEDVPVILEPCYVARLLGLNRDYIINYWKKIGLPFFKCGQQLRIEKEDIKIWIDKRKQAS